MKCADPILCYTNQNGKRVFRHFSHASYLYKSTLHQQVFRCGRCLPCRKAQAKQLATRCVLHASLYKLNCFLTLTYDETKEGYKNVLDYTEIQKFKKRLRQHVNTTEYSHIRTRKIRKKRVPRYLRKKIEIFNVHEHGENGKKHWHLIVFNYDFPDKKLFTTKNRIPYYRSAVLEVLWPYGYHSIGDVSEASAMYQAQYMEKDYKNGNVTSFKKSKSNHSGIGKAYFLRHYRQILSLGYIPFQGRRIPLPRYFEKIADKHYSHFYDPSRFHDTPFRKRIHRPFKEGQANKEIADLYLDYKQRKESKIADLETEWRNLISEHLTDQTEPDFIKSAQNQLYDLKRKTHQEKF